MIRRKPNVTLQEMKVWIHGDNSYNWTDVEKQCLNNFLGKALKRKDFFWTKWPLVLAKVRKLKRLGMNKLYTGTRPIDCSKGLLS